MIISEKIEKLESDWRIVLYDTNDKGKCAPNLRESDFHDDINEYFVQQALRTKSLLKLLEAREISPVGFFMEFHRMNVKDVASRMRLSSATVKRHLTYKGFGSVKVEMLQKYAQIFGIAVSDFFSFLYISSKMSAEVNQSSDGIVQHIRITSE
ncbi:MAG: hypothetical protein GY854_35465 [Deltaproteobacteria bacterium]|nr:hypothetical protein [Deltaproteobacteria bacterium]